MDRYFKKATQKDGYEFTKLGPTVCVFGRSGIGKTWAVHDALDPCIELTADILRSKQETLQFLEKIRGTDTPVILDEYECVQDLVGIREITGPPTNGLFVIISQVQVKLDFEMNMYEFPVPDSETIKRIVPGVSDEAIQKSRGDLHFAIQSIMFKSDEKDEFQGARDFIESLVSTNTNTNPMEFIGHSVHEPGNVTAILHENYINSTNCDYATTVCHMSDAVVLEDKIYEGNWELYPYYNFLGCVMPAVAIGHSLKPPLRPGSVWTKHQSACARAKRIEAATQRRQGRKISMDELLLLRKYIEQGNIDILKEYQLKPQDLDVMSHLTYDPKHKIKVKNLASLKKDLS